jgi:predicted signal transduction protein with EAL and GGDEF domain
VSVGIGVYPADGTDAETLLMNADRALLHAKTHGRNRLQFFEAAMALCWYGSARTELAAQRNFGESLRVTREKESP